MRDATHANASGLTGKGLSWGAPRTNHYSLEQLFVRRRLRTDASMWLHNISDIYDTTPPSHELCEVRMRPMCQSPGRTTAVRVCTSSYSFSGLLLPVAFGAYTRRGSPIVLVAMHPAADKGDHGESSHVYQACTITNPAKSSVSACKTPHECSIAGTVFPCISDLVLHFIR
jgi:hypothetical protein